MCSVEVSVLQQVSSAPQNTEGWKGRILGMNWEVNTMELFSIQHALAYI